LKYKTPKSCTLKCDTCGADLVILEVVTMTMGNNLYPITKTIYKCTNNICQEEADLRNAKKAQVRKEQEEARQKRMEDSKSASLAAKL